jgi:E3 ubiquitin-protein ligase HUWE1
VIDLITNLDMSLFHSLQGWDQMLLRLHNEVAECRKFVPNVLPTTVGKSSDGSVSMETDAPPIVDPDRVGGVEGLQCMPERAALIKSILNFVKKAIPDPMFTENIRNFVDSSLPTSLAHIVSNAEYYGPSIYLPATEVTTTFIFHDPSQLSSLQDNGLPWVILNSLINKKIPVTREVLSALPSILSSICLNSRGLQVFIESQPFDHLFGVLISPDYLPVMRRKRGNDPLGMATPSWVDPFHYSTLIR